MEYSKHGLHQVRLDGLKFRSDITNFSQDHLDYHKNLKAYLKAKHFERLIINKNAITDKKISEFNKIKKLSINKKLKLSSINNDKSFVTLKW